MLLREKSLKRVFPVERKDIRLHTLANLFRLVVDIYGLSNSKQKLQALEGEEIEAHLPALDGYLTFKPYGDRVFAFVRRASNPCGQLALTVPYEEILDVLADVIKLPNTLGGLLRIFTRYVLKGKIKIKLKGIRAVIRIFKCFMLGKHPMYAVLGPPPVNAGVPELKHAGGMPSDA